MRSSPRAASARPTVREIAIAYPSSAPAGEVATLTLSPGTPAAGDTFSLTPGGIASNGNIVAMTGLASQNLLSGQTFSNAYAHAGRPGRQRRPGGEFAAAGGARRAEPGAVGPAIDLRGQSRRAGGRSGHLSAGLSGIGAGHRQRPDAVPEPADRGPGGVGDGDAHQHQRVSARLAQRAAGAAAERQPAQSRDRHRRDHARRERATRAAPARSSGWPTRSAPDLRHRQRRRPRRRRCRTGSARCSR